MTRLRFIPNRDFNTVLKFKHRTETDGFSYGYGNWFTIYIKVSAHLLIFYVC
jgi:hypothetical protein